MPLLYPLLKDTIKSAVFFPEGTSKREGKKEKVKKQENPIFFFYLVSFHFYFTFILTSP